MKEENTDVIHAVIYSAQGTSRQIISYRSLTRILDSLVGIPMYFGSSSVSKAGKYYAADAMIAKLEEKILSGEIVLSQKALERGKENE